MKKDKTLIRFVKAILRAKQKIKNILGSYVDNVDKVGGKFLGTKDCIEENMKESI